MRVAILGCGGIIGQHMMLNVPEGVEPLYLRKTPSALAGAIDLRDWNATHAWLNETKPDVIVNLAGESRPDVVEADPHAHHEINVELPIRLALWCDKHGADLIQLGTQASFSQPGPSGPSANLYGLQKANAEQGIKNHAGNWTIVRPTFVLGIRPFPGVGRENPAELILGGYQARQVNDRFFSVSFAWEVAETLWSCVQKRYRRVILNVGHPQRFSRYELARELNPKGTFFPVSHASFPGIAPRPYDTHYTDPWSGKPIHEGFERLRYEYAAREQDGIYRRAQELAAFLRQPFLKVEKTLQKGFGFIHGQVAEDFRRANPKTETELLDWYRTTEAYLWELTAYHCDGGFNYRGMCSGIIEALKSKGVKRVLNLGDGVGTLTIAMREATIDASYHDAAYSRTESFAGYRFHARLGCDAPARWLTTDYRPITTGPGKFDAITSMDFLEHVPNVEDWARAVHEALKPGGYFVAQNAFAVGSGPNGSIPMHLACNDRFERDWDPLLKEIGFVQLASNWYQRPA